MRGRFAAIAGKDTFAFCKPDPRHLTGTIQLAGGDPARAVMVGDSKTDIDTAKAAGIPVDRRALRLHERAHGRELGADRLVSHFRDLPAAVGDLLRMPA